MRDLNQILEKMDSAIERYETCKLSLPHDQSEIVRDLSTCLYWLTPHRVDINQQWMSAYFDSKEKSAAGKEREADKKVPLMYKIRHFMASGQKVLDTMRSTISVSKAQ